MVAGYPALEGRWYKGTLIPESSGLTGILHNGIWAKWKQKVYIFHPESPDTYIYDSEADSWTTAPRTPTPRTGMGCIAENGKIYCIGGVTGNSIANSADSKVVEIFDTMTGSWSTGTDMPIANNSLACLHWKGNIYCFGGGVLESQKYTVFQYEIAADRWIRLADAPTWKNLDMTWAVLADKAYWINPLEQENFEIFDLNTGSWTYGPDIPTPRNGASFMAVKDQKIYCIAGDTNAVEYYNTTTGSWSRASSKPSADGTGILMQRGNKLYCVGDYSRSLEAYDIASDTWRVAEDVPNETYVYCPTIMEGNKIYYIGSPQNREVDIFQLEDDEGPDEPGPGPCPGDGDGNDNGCCCKCGCCNCCCCDKISVAVTTTVKGKDADEVKRLSDDILDRLSK